MNKILTPREALHRAQIACAGREMCSYDIAQKLTKWGISPQDSEQILAALVADKFIDDNRFAQSYVNDKFRFDKWGRIKIGYTLRSKQLPTSAIAIALERIDEEVYIETLVQLLTAKRATLRRGTPQEVQGKLYRYALARGYESHLILQQLKDIDPPCD